MDTKKMREQFEAAYTAYREKMGIMSYTAFHRAREVYVSSATEIAWQMWQSSREAVVIDLSMLQHQHEEGPLYYRVDDVHAAIDAQGLKVAP